MTLRFGFWAMALLAVLTLAACSEGTDSKGYPENFAQDFEQACLTTGNGNTAFCQCTLKEIQANLGPQDFVRTEEGVYMPATPKAALTMQAVVANCGQHLPQ